MAYAACSERRPGLAPKPAAAPNGYTLVQDHHYLRRTP